MACSMWLFRLTFRNYVALASLVVWQSPWFASTLCDDAGAMICSIIWCCCVEFLCDWVIFAWASCLLFSFSCLSLCGHLVHHFLVWLCLRVVVSFVVFVFLFVFTRLRGQIDERVSWLPKPILMLLEGGAAWGWRFSGVALLEGGAALGWRCSGVALVVYMDRWSTEYLLITARHRHNSVVINLCLLSYTVKVINK